MLNIVRLATKFIQARISTFVVLRDIRLKLPFNGIKKDDGLMTIVFNSVGLAGFEPAHDGTKNRCLT
ncbi:MAG: hypothetical protein ACLRX6_01365, partial [Limosilactobacillus pontis]|uniref:hypothetical protein n=1 Tax=Limosilactobacillus pontis TaxID=35787 RepID=UPI0039A07C15